MAETGKCTSNWKHMLMWDRMPMTWNLLKPEHRQELIVLGFKTRNGSD